MLLRGGIFNIGVDSWVSHEYTYDSSCLRKTKKEGRYALVTGDKDFNLKGTKHVYENYFKPVFKDRALFIQVPEMGHRNPPPEYFEKALVFLDAPLKKRSKKMYDSGISSLKRKEYAKAMKELFTAMNHGYPKARVDLEKLLGVWEKRKEKVQSYITEKKYYEASLLLKSNLKRYREIDTVSKVKLKEMYADQVINNEIKAMSYVIKAKGYLNSKDTKAKGVALLDKIMAKYADTEAAAKCKDILQQVSQ